ncbi:MAG: sugar ABC transporter ATP-binding protein [Beutenbergiaceae bacterium]
MTETLLSVEDVTISFGEVRALNGIDMTISTGEIRCLVGENGCGKSTLVKIISGVYHPSAGEVRIAGQKVDNHDPRAAIAAGIQVIYQDLSLFDHLTVAENIAINLMLHNGTRLVNRRQIHEIAREQLDRIGVDLPLNAMVSTLSIASKQLVAIARALSMDARLLFMDEPTTALTTKEVERLLSIVRQLKARGLSIVFISHKLDEVFDVADTITVFRDGYKIGDFAADELDSASLAYHMTGREVLHLPYQRTVREDDESAPVLEVESLTRDGHYRDVSFAIRQGDVLGLTGLLGAGRTELALTLFGLNPATSGRTLMDGKPIDIDAPWTAMHAGIALVPEDRSTQGLFNEQTISGNVSSTRLDFILNRWRLLSRSKEAELATQTVHSMGVNNKNIEAIAGNLSGGNQQKVVIGKWIASDPRVFILDSPTVGIDIGSKSEIYDKIQRLAAAGMAVVLISDEPEEIIANCNRVLVMHEGDVIASFDDQQRQASGFKEQLAAIIADPTIAESGAPR